MCLAPPAACLCPWRPWVLCPCWPWAELLYIYLHMCIQTLYTSAATLLAKNALCRAWGRANLPTSPNCSLAIRHRGAERRKFLLRLHRLAVCLRECPPPTCGQAPSGFSLLCVRLGYLKRPLQRLKLGDHHLLRNSVQGASHCDLAPRP